MTQPSSKCIGNDPTCPCQDGDACHYVDLPDSPAMALPSSECMCQVEFTESRPGSYEYDQPHIIFGPCHVPRAELEDARRVLRTMSEYLYRIKGPDDPWASRLFTSIYDLLGVADMTRDETAALVGAEAAALLGDEAL